MRIRVMLEGIVPEEVLRDVLKEMKETVIESYRNGLEHGRTTKGQTRKPAPHRKPAWRNKR